MAADNVTLNSGSGGAIVRTLSDGTNEWCASVACYATTVSAGANVLQVVTTSAGLPVAQQGTWTVTADAGTNLNTSALALESGGNLATIAGAVSSSKVNVNVSSGTVAATQSGTWNVGTVTAVTAITDDVTVIGTGTFAVQAAQSGNWTARVVGNSGGVVDAAGQNASSPANSIMVGGQFNTSPTTITSGNMSPLQLDSSGNLLVNVKAGGASSGTSSSFGSTYPSTGTAIGAKTASGDDMAALNLDSSGNLLVDVSNSSIAVTGTFWQTTQPVSGTITADQGGSWTVAATQSGTWTVTTDVSSYWYAQASTTSGQVGPLIQGAATTSAPSYTSGKTEPLSLDTSGNLRVLVTPSGTQTVSGTITADQGGTWNIGTVTAVTAITDTVTVAGTGTFAVQAAQSGTWTVQPGNTPNTSPWLANEQDPSVTSGSITAADTVVSSASGQLSQSILTGTPTANSSVSITLSAHAVANVQVTGTWSGTLVFERSMDGGTTYVPSSISLHGVTNGVVTSITANCVGRANVGGSTTFRVRCTAYVSGTANIKIQAGFAESVIGAALEEGSNTVGTVTAAQTTAANLNATVVGTGTFAVQAAQSGTWTAGLSAGTNLIGSIAESPQIASAYSGTTSETVQYASFSTSSSGATTIVSAVSGKKVYVLRWSVSANGNTNVNLQSHTTTSNCTGTRYLTQYASGGGAYCPLGIMATTSGEALDVNNSAAIAISGELTYVQF